MKKERRRRRQPEPEGSTSLLAQGLPLGFSGLGHSQGALQIFSFGWGQGMAPF